MANKKFKLASGKEVMFVEMSVDEIDYCNDVPTIQQDKDGNSIIKNMSAARTAWIRKGVKNATDKFIKTFTEDDKNELAIKIREHQNLGE
mgnify:CR=1 FL=1